MNLSKSEEIKYNKHSEQHALDTFTFEYNNNLDRPIDKLIKSTQENLNDLSKKYQYYQKLQNDKSEDYWKLERKYRRSGGVDMLMMDQIVDIVFIEDELKAISETKIIYGYKHFEINLNKLIRVSFGRNNNIKTFRWEDIKNFFKSKGIIISQIKGYDKLNQFRLINNMIKHSDYKIDSKIQAIREFSHSTEISHRELLNFYNRIKQCPQIFLSSLIREIWNHLYEFDERRIDKIAEDFALRMDKKTADNFIASLKKKY